MVPCGLPKKAPRCLELCRVPPTCHHEQRRPHKCHPGPCPPCVEVCGAELECGHTCTRTCHDPVPELDLSSASWARRPRDQSLSDLLAALVPAPLTLAQVKCPPCTGGVGQFCLGRHTESQMKCHERTWFSCNKPCGNVLPCGNHTCKQACHGVTWRRTDADFDFLLEVEDDDDYIVGTQENEDPLSEWVGEDLGVPPPPAPPDGGAAAAAASFLRRVKGKKHQRPNAPPPPHDCGECELACVRPRAAGCKHVCPWPCHFEQCPPCFEDVQVQCYCGQSLLTYACCEVLSWPVKFANTSEENPFLRCPMVCHNSYEHCPHMCPAKCHFGPCQPCRREVTAKCRCGKVRKQLPCAEVWTDRKQKVLPCLPDCLPEAPDVVPEEEEMPQVVEAPPEDAPDLRERRKAKQQKREEEIAERHKREEKAKRRKLLMRRVRVGFIIGVCLLIFGLLVYLVVTAPDPDEDRRRASKTRKANRR
eukprot:gnl/TRDRNA2_/TRDRNA2_160737_c1_seq1.p1 gnl/TRDRNA2_/TRDRNA2_160737_c1~~gnl/TRDRNA2_/TRDRNA2_160737_c1_seq1.p1  ORF type:complete len:522 (+),score=77.48 gnl/TRDRNA2_/TRDRNA2_160737_c1_seq1:140-1567(+)